MPDAVHTLYSERRYPALSHPATHPARLSVAARLAGLKDPAPPSSCRVLEIGCASGHNLLPMAAAYPGSSFIGLDLSEAAVAVAREAAAAAGLTNVTFEVADFTEWQPSETFDYIIAHGMFSWVADPAKERLLELCSALLTPRGAACVSYNTLPGWSLRRDVAPLVRALAAMPSQALGAEPMGVLRELEELASASASPYSNHLAATLRSMQAKGGHILSFDEFGPVCDPVYFSQFVSWSAARGLRYLGEADLAENLPAGIDPAALRRLALLEEEPLLLQQTLDLLSGRTHRVSLLCRDDAPWDPAVPVTAVLDFAAATGRDELPPAPSAVANLFRGDLLHQAPLTLSPRTLLAELAARPAARGDEDARELAAWLFHAARLGRLKLHREPVTYETAVPSAPQLSALNRFFASKALPVVDAWHISAHFPAGHERLLAQMDGRPLDDLAASARSQFPELDFPSWMAHLARRGMFV